MEVEKGEKSLYPFMFSPPPPPPECFEEQIHNPRPQPPGEVVVIILLPRCSYLTNTVTGISPPAHHIPLFGHYCAPSSQGSQLEVPSPRKKTYHSLTPLDLFTNTNTLPKEDKNALTEATGPTNSLLANNPGRHGAVSDQEVVVVAEQRKVGVHVASPHGSIQLNPTPFITVLGR